MSTSPPPAPETPSWPHCAHGANPATDPVGCRGIHVPGHTACLAHLDDADRDAYLNGLTPGADIDHRGTPFTPELLDRLLTALHDATNDRPHIGNADFDEATFTGFANFNGATFTSTVWFDEANFTSAVWFTGATFTGYANFGGATFTGFAGFDGAAFDAAGFDGAVFTGPAGFDRARFETASRLGPLVCGERVVLDGAVFDQPVTVEMAAREVSCARTRWASTATLHMRYAEVDGVGDQWGSGWR